MSLVNHTISGMFNGVSQQPYELRLDTQGEEQVNCYGTIVGALRKRPPTSLVFTNNTLNTDAYMYTYNRGLSGTNAEKYIVNIENGKLRVFDTIGNEKVVNGGINDYLYLDTGVKAKESFSCVTVGDTTLIVNKTAQTQIDLGYSGTTSTVHLRSIAVATCIIIPGSISSGRSSSSYTSGTLSLSVTINGVTKVSSSDILSRTSILQTVVNQNYTEVANNTLRNTLALFKGTSDYVITDRLIKSASTLTMSASLTWVPIMPTYGISGGTLSTNSIVIGTEIVSNTDAWEDNFYYWVKRTNPDVSYPANNYTYYIYINDVVKATAIGANATTIATSLSNQMIAQGYASTALGSVVKITVQHSDKISGSDSWGEQASVSWRGSIPRIQDLPRNLGSEGDVMQVIGDDKNAFTGFYIRYNNSTYTETVRPMLSNQFDSFSMPHKLVRESDGTFTFSPIIYNPRKVGDEVTARNPSFIGSTIQSLFFFKNRLGFISGGNVILSEVGEYFNFYPTTVTTVLDSDPIDVAVDSNQVVNLSHAIPFNKNILLFSDKAQFSIQGSEVLSPKTVSANQSTSFEFNSKAAPVNIGPNVYFGVPTGSFSSVREYFVDSANVSNDAADITAHVPTYVPANISKLVGGTGLDILFALSEDTPNTLYVYKFYWSGDTKAQSAWSKWTFDGLVHNMAIIDNELYILITRGTSTNLEKLKLELAPPASTVYLDNGLVPYQAKYTYSRWRIKAADNNVDNSRGRLQVRTFSASVSDGSVYDIEVANGPRTRRVTGKGTIDNKVLVMGHTDRVLISIVNDDITGKGFQINTASFEGNYTVQSRNI